MLTTMLIASHAQTHATLYCALKVRLAFMKSCRYMAHISTNKLKFKSHSEAFDGNVKLVDVSSTTLHLNNANV